MNTEQSFCNSTYEQQTHLAERELAAFIEAVKRLFGPEQARLAAEDWLDECDLMDSPPRSTGRDWRAVTVAASARLAKRLTAEADYRTPLAASAVAPVTIDAKVLAILSSNCFASALLV